MTDIIIIIISSVAALAGITAVILSAITAAKSGGGDKREIDRLSSTVNAVQTGISQRIAESESSQSQNLQNSLSSFSKQLDIMRETVDKRIDVQTQNQQNSLTTFGKQVEELRAEQNRQLQTIRETMEKSIEAMRESNSKKLDEIRGTVDEKLQTTLNDRFTQSFKLVEDRLTKVYEGLGEMQTLASGVGDLKKILSNVKTRGVFGEVQLDRILEQILTSDQYAKNVKTKKGSQDAVEFAICLPNDGDPKNPVYLPIDAKFPLDRYEAVCDAAESGDNTALDAASKALEAFIKENAKKIRDKYIDPPYTTSFALMFLPTEGLYAEVVKRTTLIEFISREYNISVAGPSTISAVLNSLQMGFRTLAIEKRSNEVWTLLGAVRTEFDKFSSALEKVKEKLNSADTELDKLINTRTNAMQRKLRNIEALPDTEAKKILDSDYGETDDDIS